MYSNPYEDYIRSILGYPNYNSQPDYFQDYNCNTCNLANSYNYDIKNEFNENKNSELEECYPEIYKIVYPMVQKACQDIPETITKEKLDNLVDEIYSNLEGNDQIILNINLNNSIENVNHINNDNTKAKSTSQTQVPRMFNGKRIIEEPKRDPKYEQTENKIENRNSEEEPRETRQFNRNLSDIIRILLIRELLGRPNRPGNRPPFPPPGRPPRPPYRPVRPPYNRDWENDIYEY